MKRTLVLKKESLTELTSEELGGIVGGTTPPRTGTPLVTFVPCAFVTVVVETVVDGCFT